MPDRRPSADEYAPHHEQYVSLVQRPILDELHAQRDAIRALTTSVTDEHFRYAPNKWTIREVVGHCADAERIHAYRALCIARGDTTDLPKWSPDGYATVAGFDDRTIANLVDEMLLVRDATLSLLERLPRDAWSRVGRVSGRPQSVRATAYIAAGHVLRHLNVLYERYGVSKPA